MHIRGLLVVLAAGLNLAACADVSAPSGPPPAGYTAGPGAPPLQQQSRSIGGGSPDASSGVPSFQGTQGTRPTIEYSGQGGNVGSPTAPSLPTTGRSRGP